MASCTLFSQNPSVRMSSFDSRAGMGLGHRDNSHSVLSPVHGGQERGKFILDLVYIRLNIVQIGSHHFISSIFLVSEKSLLSRR